MPTFTRRINVRNPLDGQVHTYDITDEITPDQLASRIVGDLGHILLTLRTIGGGVELDPNLPITGQTAAVEFSITLGGTA